MSEMPSHAPGCASCAARDGQVAELAAQVKGLQDQVKGLQDQVKGLQDQVKGLQERNADLERAASRNSGNSSMPPGSDDLPGRKAPRKQRRAQERAEGEKRNRGKQPGAPGAAMRWEDPDRTEDHYPEGACGCGRDLADAADLGVARSYQQDEIPAAPAERVQHDLHETRCACGREPVAPRPPGVPDAALSIGPRLPGPAGEKKYVHGAFTEEYSSFYLGTRSLETMRQAGILPDFAGVVVSDRYQNYFHESWEHFAGNQACLAHILRDYQDCAETYPDAVWPVQAQRALRRLIPTRHAAPDQQIPPTPPPTPGPLHPAFPPPPPPRPA